MRKLKQKMNIRRIIAATTLLAVCLAASADEGMWMIQSIDKSIHKNMKSRGLKLSAEDIYNPANTAASLSGAIVSLDFIGTGSIISGSGLVITNHHCAYDDVHSLSTPEQNYLEDGFWASDMSHEIPIPGKRMLILKNILDVTDEVNMVFDTTGSRGKLMGFRKVSSIIEKKYSAESGLEAYLNSMWSGTKYYLSLYEVYTDIRLVAAPPVSIAAFGGDTDNWEWPQHKCDFALYRIYTAPDGSPADYSEGNVPMKSSCKLDIAPKSVKSGDYTMVIGFPGRTNRYNSSYKTEFEKDITLPIESSVRGETMEILRKWMNADPEVRLKYADKFFSLSNAQELYSGEVLCYNLFGVVDEVRAMEEDMLRKDYSELLDALKEDYRAMAQPQKSLEYYRESLIRGCGIYGIQTRVRSLVKNRKSKLENVQAAVAEIVDGMDLRVEKDLFFHVIDVFYSNVDSAFFGEYQTELCQRFGGDSEAIATYLWDSSWIGSKAGIEGFLRCEDYGQYVEDPIIRFYGDTEFSKYSNAVADVQTAGKVSALNAEYTRALYQVRKEKGIPQYPDANSTMRITYGTVASYSPRDGVLYDWHSSVGGILEKHNPAEYDFSLKPDWKGLLETAPASMTVDFITDNDITGGNSGSPVLNSRGQVVGLAFDGNKESLASDASFTPAYNRTVCVDINYILFTLKYYAGMDWILKEINE